MKLAVVEEEDQDQEENKVDETESEKCLVKIMNYREPHLSMDISGDAGNAVNTSNSLAKDAKASAANVAEADHVSKDNASETSS